MCVNALHVLNFLNYKFNTNKFQDIILYFIFLFIESPSITRFCFKIPSLYIFSNFPWLTTQQEREGEREKERSDAARAVLCVRCGGWSCECVHGERERQIGVKGEEAGRALVAWKQGRAKHTLWQRGIPHSASEDVRSFTLSRGAARREATSVS